MQTVISQIASTFVDDAIALVTGLGRITVDLVTDLLASARSRLMAPIDRLARACDVAGIISARDAAKTRSRSGGAKLAGIQALRRRQDRIDIFGICATFRTLRDLT
jgi:hypothetical protein